MLIKAAIVISGAAIASAVAAFPPFADGRAAFAAHRVPAARRRRSRRQEGRQAAHTCRALHATPRRWRFAPTSTATCRAATDADGRAADRRLRPPSSSACRFRKSRAARRAAGRACAAGAVRTQFIPLLPTGRIQGSGRGLHRRACRRRPEARNCAAARSLQARMLWMGLKAKCLGRAISRPAEVLAVQALCLKFTMQKRSMTASARAAAAASAA